MVAPVSGSGIGTLQRAQQTTNVNQTANRQVAQAVLNRTPVSKASPADKTISLASANVQPQSNLPRGSIVDKLV
jgi:hypothetical protein